MVKKRGYNGSYDELDALFDYAKTNADHRIYAEVRQKLTEVKDRQIYNKLEEQLTKMNIKDKGKTKTQDDSKNKSIKEKLKEGKFNPLYGVPFQGVMKPAKQESSQDFKQPLLGKRSDPTNQQ